MSKVESKMPTVVKVLGWGWLAVGCLMILSGGMAFIVSTIMNQARGFPASTKAPPQFAPMLIIFQHFGILALIQIALAGFIVFTSAQFLKRREWARVGLIVLSFLAAAYVIGFSIFWIYMWVSITGAASASSHGNPPPPGFSLIGIVGGIVNMVIFSTPPILSIIALRGKTVRDAISGVPTA
jgi:glucan phosphoethanolaminetransferase (alkaline phosphatase superfamily)